MEEVREPRPSPLEGRSLKMIVTDDRGATLAASVYPLTAEVLEIPAGPFLLVLDAGAAKIPTNDLYDLGGALQSQLCSFSGANVTLVVLENGAKLSIVDEEKMRALGWVRA